MYANLKAELLANGISLRAAAAVIGVHENTLSRKINEENFFIDEALSLSKNLLPKYDFEYLFTPSEEKIKLETGSNEPLTENKAS